MNGLGGENKNKNGKKEEKDKRCGSHCELVLKCFYEENYIFFRYIFYDFLFCFLASGYFVCMNLFPASSFISKP